MLDFYTNTSNAHHLIKSENFNTNVSETQLTSLMDNNDKHKTDISIKCEKYEICEGCGHKIHDRYLFRVGDLSWHEQCLLCCICGINLNYSCYSRNTKLYCKADYDRIFSVKCSRCNERVLPQDMVMRVQQFVYHLPCFSCSICTRPLEKGEHYFMRGGQLFCRLDYEKDLYSGCSMGPEDMDDEMLMDEGIITLRARDGRRGPKRPRTILTSAQRRQFKASFEVSPKPCRKVREALAKDTGLSVRVVQVWFQNQRAKMKKIQRKGKHDGGDKNSSDKESLLKDEKSVKRESPTSENNYIGMDNNSFGSSGQPINQFSPDDYPANSNDSFCSSDVSLDGSSFDHMDEGTSDAISFQNLDLQRHNSNSNYASNNNNNLHENMMTSLTSGIINPIDKLYLMQNSYFNSEQ